MQFRTPYTPVYNPALDIDHTTAVWLVGSCFSDNIGALMQAEGFDVRVNPLGTLYNPVSIARSLNDVIDSHHYSCGDLVANGGLWHSLMHHSRFSSADPAATVATINDTIDDLHSRLPGLDMLIITLGSAMEFYDTVSGQVVANCHKLPGTRFELREQSVGLITDTLSTLIGRLRIVAPRLRMLFTVSPIRHRGYGIVRDRLSKSRLLLAIDMLVHNLDDVYYFPAYDIMMDDLRDYRFYAADMIHPSDTAVAYIYDLFTATTNTPATRTAALAAARAARRAAHRPLHP